MNPREFQKVATGLLGHHSPAHNRSAISRAYYAAFHVALMHLRANGFTFSKSDSRHNEVSRHLLWCDDKLVKAIGSELSDFRGVRNKADYDLEVAELETDKTAALWAKAAERHIEELDQAFGGANKDAIVATIMANKKKAMG